MASSCWPFLLLLAASLVAAETDAANRTEASLRGAAEADSPAAGVPEASELPADVSLDDFPFVPAQAGSTLVGGNVTAFSGEAVNAYAYNYQWSASSTRYGNARSTSCGGLDTAAVVAGTGYYAVASSQAMQSAFLWGASCCYCGAAAEGQAQRGTAPMGCFTCARGRFLNRQPQVNHGQGSGFASHEIKVVVLDVCPGDSTGWCQPKPGDVNVYGEKNHLDFCVPPPGINNNYFVFTQEECSHELQRRMAPGKEMCAKGGPGN